MKVLKLVAESLSSAVESCAAEVRRGGAIIYPTDTVYALGVLPTVDAAIDTAYSVKQRSRSKPLSLCFADFDQASNFVVVNEKVRLLAEAFLPGPITIVCKARGNKLKGIHTGRTGIGVRVPGHPFGPTLARLLDCPVTATSANISGGAPAVDGKSALQAFSHADEKPSLLVDDGPSEIKVPSTVIDLSKGEIKLIREGAISLKSIKEALGVK